MTEKSNELIHRSSSIDIKRKDSSDILHADEQFLTDDINPNMSYSVYIDTKRIMPNTPPDKDFISNKLNSIYPKEMKKWVESDLVINCQICNTSFGIFTRKHHCRACGGVFCHKCCHDSIVIPEKYVKKPVEDSNYRVKMSNVIRHYTNNISNFSLPFFGKKTEPKVSFKIVEQPKSLVCTECFKKIKNIEMVSHLINICSFLDLKTLYTVLIVSKNWYNASIHQLSRFRQIQYADSDKLYNKWESSMLWLSRSLIIGHNNWYTTLVKCALQIYYEKRDKSYLDELRHLLPENEKKLSCWNLMCSRKCNMKLDILDYLELLKFVELLGNKNLFWMDQNMKNIFGFLIQKLSNSTTTDDCLPKYIMPLLCNIFCRLLNVDKSIIDVPYLTNVLNLLTGNANMMYAYVSEMIYLNSCQSKNPDFHNFILFSKNYIATKLGSSRIEEINKMIIKICKLITSPNVSKTLLDVPIIYPLDYNWKIVKVNDIIRIKSNTAPLLLNVNLRDNLGNTKNNVKFIIKNDIVLRKEQIVSCLIILLQQKLCQQSHKKRINSFDAIPTYQIKLLSSNIGVIEFVEDSVTLRMISEMGYTLQNYVLENNSEEKTDNIKRRFLQSLAISSCISYLLGLGDRHLDNIMINKKGQLFHIDYGYLLDNPTAYNNIVLSSPNIKMTTHMIDFLGGLQGSYYSEFKDFMTKVYDIMRLYKNAIVNYYEMIGLEGFVKWDIFRDRLENRFMNGMKTKDIEITLINEVETSNNWQSSTIDMVHGTRQKIADLLNI